jgi:hypothetical protein
MPRSGRPSRGFHLQVEGECGPRIFRLKAEATLEALPDSILSL